MSVSVTSLEGRSFGAVIEGPDVRSLDHRSWTAVEEAFHEYGVVVIKGQSLDVDEHVAFARRFGEIEMQSASTMRADFVGKPIVLDISNVDDEGNHIRDRNHPQTRYLGGNEGWHSDSSFKEVSAKASVLHAREVPTRGGATGYADARGGYDALPEHRRAELDGMRAYHSLEYSQAVAKASDDEVPADPTTMAGAWHPLVRTHPATGRRSLFIGRHAAVVEGMSPAESRVLLDELEDHTCQGPRVYYHAWEVGDVVVWDNRCMLHRATSWDLDERRVLRHVRVAGDPVRVPAGSAK
jgi:alpha-ketoglutarate-dependent taurine dioxygenase